MVGSRRLPSRAAVGVELRAADDLTLTISGFRNEFEDLIDFDFDLFTNVNRSRVDTEGVELSARYQADDATMVGSSFPPAQDLCRRSRPISMRTVKTTQAGWS